MTKFFDSEIVQKELAEIQELQKVIYSAGMSFAALSKDDRVEHIDNLTELLAKQRVMYTRLSLSEDSQAKKMKEDLVNSVTSLGFPIGTDVNLLFSSMENSIEMLKSHIDD
tara:strand:+ start:297 stop:629 length:333 start_codon:yes stop_codon:yes gene_type:complete